MDLPTLHTRGRPALNGNAPPAPQPIAGLHRIVLAPMEGLLDHHLRDIITSVGGIDLCVSEFIRVTDRLLPERVFTRIVPELLSGGRTAAGTPVRAQLLGSDPACLADNAARLATLKPAAIDLNFGCPAPTVNRHRGGAVLLDEPELVHAIVAAVRRAVPPEMSVTAKMRLGHQDDALMLDNARAIEAGGAAELTVHARTKVHGYRPPAYWPQIAAIRAAVALPVVANGEIWTLEDARRCLAQSGCDALMLGRGIVADPGLALALRGAAVPGWAALLPLVRRFWRGLAGPVAPRHQAGRLKQWLNMLRRSFPEAQALFDAVRASNDPGVVQGVLLGETAGAAAVDRCGGVRPLSNPSPAASPPAAAPAPAG